jgi:type IV secretory pathway TrbD component
VARPARLEPTVFLAMISPITVGLVVGSVALVLLVGGPWWLAALAGVAVWAIRVLISTQIATRVKALPRRIDPFALREPWRFFVRDALRSQRRFAEATDRLAPGPLRNRLLEISVRVNHGVEECWEVAQRGQHLTDSRRSIDVDRIRRTLDTARFGPEDPRRTSAEVQLASHDRILDLEHHTRERLEILDARLTESVVRASELSARAADLGQLDEIADAVDGIVGDLESLRLGLDAADDGESA